VRTNESHENIVALSDIREEKLRALSPYGPVKVGLTTLPSQGIVEEDHEARLSELLNSLESEVESLRYKSFTAYDTLNTAIEDLRAALSDIAQEGGTDADWS
jgi:hypothetical protein